MIAAEFFFANVVTERGFHDRRTTRENLADVLHHLHLAAAALGLPANILEQAMTKQVIATARDRVEVPLTADAAKDALDALVKKIYASVFDSIVAKINDQTHDLHFAESDAIISVLDIYGFESFDINRFEQLCINYANEKLHKKYVDDNFQRFKVEYEREGIELFDFNKVDNSDILCVFEGRSGLLNAINEECVRRNGSSEVRECRYGNVKEAYVS